MGDDHLIECTFASNSLKISVRIHMLFEAFQGISIYFFQIVEKILLKFRPRKIYTGR